MSSVAVIPTAPLHGYQVIFSPYSPSKIAFAGSYNYGIAGRGALVLYEEVRGHAEFREVNSYGWSDGLFDVTWSEVNEAILVAASGDGSVIVVDQGIPGKPAAVLRGHTAEVSSVQWSVVRQEQVVLSASWDGSVRVWDPQALSCIATFGGHVGNVYAACWSPHLPHTFASVASDETLRIWDSTHPPNSKMQLHAHSGEILTCDWSKYDQNLLFTGGVDRTIRCWDLRQPSLPVATLSGHTQAVRRLKCDPFHGSVLASASYDFSVRVWDVGKPVSPLVETIAHHTEFTFGLDFSSLEAGKVCGASLNAE